MLKNRLCYLIILLCTGAFFICFNGYYSMYAFLLSLALPVLSLILSLPGMLTLRAAVSTPGKEHPVRAGKNEAVPLHITTSLRWVVPSGRARVQLSIKNHFTGEVQLESLEFSPSRRPQILEHKLTSGVCGKITCRLTKARAYDLLGLFWLPVRLGPDSGCQIIVQPTVYRPALGLHYRYFQNGEGERYSPHKPGDDLTELFGLRDYRPGDRLSRVDWKLSQKGDELLVREASLPAADRALLLADLSGDALEADSLMDALATLASFFAERELAYLTGSSRDGHYEFLEVARPEETYPAIETVLCRTDRLPLSGRFPGSAPADISRVAYLCPVPDPAVLTALENRYPGAGLCVISTRPLESRSGLPLEAQWVRVRPGYIAQDMDGLLV